MDTLTTAIVAALSSGVGSGVTKAGEDLISESYQSLKNLLKRKFGTDSRLVKAVDDLESKRDSTGRKETLKEEVAEAKADQDSEIREAVRELLQRLQAKPGVNNTISINGDQNLGMIGDISGSTIVIGGRKED